MSAVDKEPVTGALARFTAWQLICYGALSLPIALSNFALLAYLPTYYAVDLGIGLSVVGLVFVIGRFLDVITDPVIGYLSDRTRSRWGPRRPWMFLTLPIYLIVVWAIFNPGEGVGIGFLLICSILYFITYTAIDVPYSAVGLEISPHLHERSTLASSKAMFQIGGAITASLVPLIALGVTKAALSVMAVTVIVTAIMGAALFFLFVPARPKQHHHRATPVKAIWAACRKNPSFKTMLFAFGWVQTANALSAGLMVLFITHRLARPELTGLIFGIVFLSTALGLPIWLTLAKRIGKARCWQAGIALGSLALMGSFFVGSGDVILLAICGAVLGVSFGGDAVMPTSILADIVERDDKTVGASTGGFYLALKNAVSKLTFIAPMGIAFPLLDWAGLSAAASGEGAQSLWVLIALFAGVPLVFRGLGFAAAGRLARLIDAQSEQTNLGGAGLLQSAAKPS